LDKEKGKIRTKVGLI